jgi:endonuclease III
MAKASKRQIARTLLQRFPESYADRLRIGVGKNTPSALYQWLIGSLLFSARISSDTAEVAAAALFDKGWRTPRKMATTTWGERVKVLNRSGYARYDESTSRYIGEATTLLLERYGGDLRRLREAAGRDPDRERALLKQFKGIGEVGADIFFREAQVAWEEIFPFADAKALKVAGHLGLGRNAGDLARVVERRADLPRLLSALVAAHRAKELDRVLQEAA